MHKGGPQISAQDTLTKQQQQKQKKRLSFKDPEIEGPQQPQFYAGCRPRKGSWSVENLSLEDQALQIVHNVGSAFSELSLNPESSQSDSFNTFVTNAEIEDSQAEALINDCFLSGSSSYQWNCHSQSYPVSTDDQEFSPNRNAPLQTSSMRCPPIENNEHNPYRNSIPPMERTEEKYPSSAQHQIQLLKYQLDQQSQQTQLALHQVQLLTDQMEAESAARRKAQEQNNQLMTQNQELLHHIEKLFQQIEDLEKQIQISEGERRSARVTNPQEQQMQTIRNPIKPTSSYMGSRRPSAELTGRNILPASKRQQTASLAPTKQVANQPKSVVNQYQQNPTIPQRKGPMSNPAPKSFTTPQNRMTEQSTKGKDTLHIGDMSPPIQSGTMSPFGSGWKLKPSERSQTEEEGAPPARTRTGSFSSFSKLKPPEINIKNSSFSSNSSLSTVSGITSKKYSSSTSDLYNSPITQLSSAFQSIKSPGLEDNSAPNKGAISNVNVSATSKLPRFQPYVGRRSSLTKDFEQFAAIGKEKVKSNTQSSLYNR